MAESSSSNPPPVPLVSLRGTKGIQLLEGTNFEPAPGFNPDPSKACRLTAWSHDGKYFAWANGTVVNVLDIKAGKLVAQLPKPKTSGLKFSPKRNYLVTWEPYAVTKDNPANTPNLHVWKLDTKESVKSYVQKSNSRWEPEWSSDEKLLARNLNQELQVYEVDKMESISQKMLDTKVSDFSLSPGPAPYYFLIYIQGTKGQPSFAKLYKYPNLAAGGLVASKSFFQGDRVEMKWNKQGNAALLLTSTDVDTTGASYYGKQTLHMLDVKGNSAMVQLPKDGPIYAVEWNPKGNEFCVIYGFMPAKATLYDLKCEAKFDFGTGPRNSAFYNPFGNVLLLGGFGNLRGKIEVWDIKTMKLVTPIEAPDSTHLQWSPNGQHFMTSTTAPRLRVGNGFKIWHYSGSLLHEKNIESPDELWESTFQPFTDGIFKDFPVSAKKVGGIQPSAPQVSKELYRPPGARNSTHSAILKCLEEREAPSDPRAPKPIPGMGKPSEQKPKKKNEKKKKNAAQDGGEKAAEPAAPPVVKPEVVYVSNIEIKLTGNEEVDKQLKDLKKNLDHIGKMKLEQAAGKKLELNQIEKINKEEEFRKKFEKLSLQKK